MTKTFWLTFFLETVNIAINISIIQTKTQRDEWRELAAALLAEHHGKT